MENAEVKKISKVQEDLSIELEDARTREVERFKYLGVNVSASGEREGKIEE